MIMIYHHDAASWPTSSIHDIFFQQDEPDFLEMLRKPFAVSLHYDWVQLLSCWAENKLICDAKAT